MTSQRKFTLFSPLGLDGLSTLGTLDIPSRVGPTSLGQGEGTHRTASNLTTPVFTLFYVFFPFNSSQVVLKRPTFGLEKHIFANNISRSRAMPLEATPVLLPPAEGGYSCEQADLPCSASPLTATPSGGSATSTWKARSQHIPCCPPPKSVTAAPGGSGKQRRVQLPDTSMCQWLAGKSGQK